MHLKQKSKIVEIISKQLNMILLKLKSVKSACG